MIKRIALAAAGLGLALCSPVMAQENAAPDTATQEHALEYLKVLISALQSENVGDDIKSVLVACIYQNSLGEMTAGMDKVLAANPSVDRKDPSKLLGIMAGMCGYRPAGETAPENQGR